MRSLSEEEVSDLLTGAEILGCGGGGERERALPMIEEVYGEGDRFRIAAPHELPDDAMTFIAGTVGGGVRREITEKLSSLPRVKEKVELLAVKELSESIGEEPYAFLSTEIGAGNMVVPMYVAAATGKYAVDADCCGRAKPEIAISTTHVKGISITPLAAVTPFGDLILVKHALDDYRAEDLCRHIAVSSGGTCGVARCPSRGKEIRDAVINNSISKCVQLGEEVRTAARKGRDPVEASIEMIGGFKLFEGSVKQFQREEREAFMWGNIVLEGGGSYSDHRLRIWFKNEHLVSWLDDEPYVTCPDLICTVDSQSGRGLSNWGRDFSLGREVTVIGAPAADIWRSNKGLKIFGPRHFGFTIPYTPVEKLMRDNS